MNTDRQKYEHQGKVIYEWQQSIDSVSVFIKPPPILIDKKLRSEFAQKNPGVALPTLEVKISNQRVTVAIKGNPPYLDLKTKKLVDTSQSLWFVEGDTLQINLQKAFKGESWLAAFEGHELSNPLQAQKIGKSLLLQRFQQENPGFDFSSAEVNGQVPDARTFMGGIKHN